MDGNVQSSFVVTIVHKYIQVPLKTGDKNKNWHTSVW